MSRTTGWSIPGKSSKYSHCQLLHERLRHFIQLRKTVSAEFHAHSVQNMLELSSRVQGQKFRDESSIADLVK